MGNPFAALGLPVSRDLTDDDVRAAWRRIATATHPDREDGGDPARYAEAADAYSRLRTGWDRGEAYADLTPGDRGPGSGVRLPGPRRLGPRRLGARRLGGQLTRGRPVVLGLRAICAAAVSVGAYAAVGWAPATPALITGALTWLLLTGHRDLAPRNPTSGPSVLLPFVLARMARSHGPSRENGPFSRAACSRACRG